MSNLLYDIFILTETWLTENIATSELGFYRYELLRYDRNPQTSFLSKGGSVLIVVRNNFISKLILLHNVKIEFLFFNIRLPQCSFIISSVYILNRSTMNI